MEKRKEGKRRKKRECTVAGTKKTKGKDAGGVTQVCR